MALTRISHSTVHVLDQDAALDFYVGTLGLEVAADADLGVMRWLTVRVPGDEHEILLSRPGPPMVDDATAAQVRDLVTKGALGGIILTTDDCRGTYAALRAKGVEFTEEPEDRFYGTDCALRDPFGNHIRITEPVQGEMKVPEPGELA